MQTGDFNRDGRDDLVGRNPTTGEWLIARSTGTSAVNETWGAWTMPGTYVDVMVGAFAEPDNAAFQPAPVYRNEFDKAGKPSLRDRRPGPGDRAPL